MLNAPIIGEANEFIHLQRMLRQRKDALQISNITLADISGLPEGLVNKMMSDPPSKNIGVMSFGLLLQALALKLVVIEDLDLRGKLQGRWVKRKEQQVRVAAACCQGNIEFKISRRKMLKIQKMGGKARQLMLSKDERRELGLRGAQGRWGKATQFVDKRRAVRQRSV